MSKKKDLKIFFERISNFIDETMIQSLQSHGYKEDSPPSIFSPHQLKKQIEQVYEQPHLLYVAHGKLFNYDRAVEGV
jgi:hypothetical protein